MHFAFVVFGLAFGEGDFTFNKMAFPVHRSADAGVTFLLHGGKNIRQLAIFPVGADGETVDDVLLARHEPVASNQTVALDTGLKRCGPISVWLQFADGEEVSAKTDLCRNNHLIAHD